MGSVDNNAASSAQSKHMGGGKMAYLGSSWVKLGCAGQDGVIYGEWWVSTVVDGVINDVAGV